jgi:MSHA pilin protein MshD
MLNGYRGATLIELVVSITIISIALATLMILSSQTTGHSVDPLIRQQSLAIAHSYMEEIVQKGFCDPDVAADCVTACVSSACSLVSCTAPEGARNVFDDVCDYDGLVDNGAMDQNGVALPGLDRYSISVQVIDSGISLGPAGNQLNANNGEVVRLDVSVTHPAMPDAIRLSGYRSNY